MGYDAEGTSRTGTLANGPGRLGTSDSGSVTSPAVRLSPNARNVVFNNTGIGGFTRTVKPHDAVCPTASVAVHDTAVVPTEKVEPEAGVHVTVTGGVPSMADGVVNEATAVTLFNGAVADTSSGQLRLSAGLALADADAGCAVDVGDVGDPPPLHALVHAASTRQAARAARRRRVAATGEGGREIGLTVNCQFYLKARIRNSPV